VITVILLATTLGLSHPTNDSSIFVPDSLFNHHPSYFH